MLVGRKTRRPVIDLIQAEVVDADAVSAMLTPAELRRVGGFRTAESRAAVATARALLRCALAARTGQRPGEVTLTQQCAQCGGPHGKPLVGVPDGCAPVHASVSYSGALVLVATADVPVGVDVEQCAATAFPGFDDIALCSAERAELADVPGGGRAARRAQWWVRKEAVLKIGGLGLNVPPSDVDVRYVTARPLRVPAQVVPSCSASVQDVSVPPEYEATYRAAVAVAGRKSPTISVRDGHPILAAAAARVGTATA